MDIENQRLDLLNVFTWKPDIMIEILITEIWEINIE